MPRPHRRKLLRYRRYSVQFYISWLRAIKQWKEDPQMRRLVDLDSLEKEVKKKLEEVKKQAKISQYFSQKM